MNFLVTPIRFSFLEFNNLTKTKYSYRISNIHDSDIARLNIIIKKLDKDMKIIGNSIFVNGKTVLFLRNNEKISFMEDVLSINTISIQGFKTSSIGTKSPIWKLVKSQSM